MSGNTFFKMKGDMEMARNTAVYRKETKQGFTRNAHAHILPRDSSQCVNSPTEAARARALLTAREARLPIYESARTAEDKLPTNDGSDTSFGD